MIELPEHVRSRLGDPAYRRSDVRRVREGLEALRVTVPEAFGAFFERYAGPFSSRTTGFELLDLCEGTPNVLQLTETSRREYGWPVQLVVLTDLLGNAVLVLDAGLDRVFNVDFEGGDELLLAGQLAPMWTSFHAFLGSYFA